MSTMLPSQPAAAAFDLDALAREAVVWGIPLVLSGRFLDRTLKAGYALDQFYVNGLLATPHSGAVGPNIDTLYGFAWLDLSAGPQLVGVPDTGKRYFSIQLQDMYMNSFAYIGQRTTGGKGSTFAITPPGFTGALPEGVQRIEAPTTKVFALVRTFVRDAADLPRALDVQKALSTDSLAGFPGTRKQAIVRDDWSKLFGYIDLSSAGPGYFTELDTMSRAYPPLPWDAANLQRFAPLGVGNASAFAPPPGVDLAAAVTAGYALVRSSMRFTSVNGWLKRDSVAPFIRDPLQRAANSFFGPGTHTAEECVYWGTRQGGLGDWLDGNKRYRLRFAPGQTPPVDSFWSITLYDGKYALFDNPLDRYAILDRTPGLRFEPDGSLVIQIQADEPAEGKSNWLPAPRGPFQLNPRAYLPQRAILDGSYNLPPLEII